MSIDSGLANPIPDNGLDDAPDLLLESEATLADVDEEMARGTQHADWVGHAVEVAVEVASANKIYMGEGLESCSRTGFAREPTLIFAPCYALARIDHRVSGVEGDESDYPIRLGLGVNKAIEHEEQLVKRKACVENSIFKWRFGLERVAKAHSRFRTWLRYLW